MSCLFSHHNDGGEQRSACGHHDEAVNETGVPNDSVANPHGFESLLEAQLLLQHDALHGHGHRIDPGQHHEQGETAVQCDHEAGEEGEEEEAEYRRTSLRILHVEEIEGRCIKILPVAALTHKTG